MAGHLYLSRYELFNYKFVHIVITNSLHLNTDFFFIFYFHMLHISCNALTINY